MSPVSTSRFPKPRYEPLHDCLTTAVAQRRVWVTTLPLSCRRRCEPSPLGQSEPPGRRPPDARSLHLRLLRHRSFLCRFGSGGNFHRSRGFPSRRASASRLPNAGTSLATLLSFANGVVTRRRVQVNTLPLSAPGSLSAPWPPSFLRQAPITAEDSRSFVRRSFRITPGPFQLGSGGDFVGRFRFRFPTPSSFRLATPRPMIWAFSQTLRRCDSAVHSSLARPLIHSGRISAPWPPPSCARLPRPSDVPMLP